jgi:hypothetical protein
MSTWNNSIGTAMLDKVEISIGHAKHEAMVCSSCNKESKYGTPKEIPKGFICKQQIRLYDFDFIKSVLPDTTDEINEQFMDEYTLCGFALGESPEWSDLGFIPDNEEFLATQHGDKLYCYELCNGTHFEQQTCGGGFVIDQHYGSWLDMWDQLLNIRK